MTQQMQAQVAPVPVYEYQLVELDYIDEKELERLGAEGWGVAAAVEKGNRILFARQKAIRMVPVEEPALLGVGGTLVLRHPAAAAGKGNGRS